mmetsp:Transcript_19052/g.28634  ORF Transcript_19052/g.28634 Transcript_19052/m.28634 type:complete len:96 (+) Transcript_19052:127-414(+)
MVELELALGGSVTPGGRVTLYGKADGRVVVTTSRPGGAWIPGAPPGPGAGAGAGAGAGPGPGATFASPAKPGAGAKPESGAGTKPGAKPGAGARA